MQLTNTEKHIHDVWWIRRRQCSSEFIPLNILFSFKVYRIKTCAFGGRTDGGSMLTLGGLSEDREWGKRSVREVRREADRRRGEGRQEGRWKWKDMQEVIVIGRFTLARHDSSPSCAVSCCQRLVVVRLNTSCALVVCPLSVPASSRRLPSVQGTHLVSVCHTFIVRLTISSALLRSALFARLLYPFRAALFSTTSFRLSWVHCFTIRCNICMHRVRILSLLPLYYYCFFFVKVIPPVVKIAGVKNKSLNQVCWTGASPVR